MSQLRIILEVVLPLRLFDIDMALELVDWIQKKNPPKSVRDRLHRTEKAVDTQICCDALELAVKGRLDRLFLYTNDYDFLPLCNALKAAGSNISLFR